RRVKARGDDGADSGISVGHAVHAPSDSIGRSRFVGNELKAGAEQDCCRGRRDGYGGGGRVVASATCQGQADDEREARPYQPRFHAFVSNFRDLSGPFGARASLIQNVRLTVKRKVEVGSKKLIRCVLTWKLRSCGRTCESQRLGPTESLKLL